MYSITYLDRKGGVGGRATCLLWELNQLTTTVQAVWQYNDMLCVRLCRVMPGRRAESGVGKYNADRVGNLLPSFLCKSLVFRQKSVNRSFALFKRANHSFCSFSKEWQERIALFTLLVIALVSLFKRATKTKEWREKERISNPECHEHKTGQQKVQLYYEDDPLCPSWYIIYCIYVYLGKFNTP